MTLLENIRSGLGDMAGGRRPEGAHWLLPITGAVAGLIAALGAAILMCIGFPPALVAVALVAVAFAALPETDGRWTMVALLALWAALVPVLDESPVTLAAVGAVAALPFARRRGLAMIAALVVGLLFAGWIALPILGAAALVLLARDAMLRENLRLDCLLVTLAALALLAARLS